MPRGSLITFGDLEGKLDLIALECEKCGRKGRYRVDRLLAERGRDATIADWQVEMTADCPKRQQKFNLLDLCGATSPNLAAALMSRAEAPRARPGARRRR